MEIWVSFYITNLFLRSSSDNPNRSPSLVADIIWWAVSVSSSLELDTWNNFMKSMTKFTTLNLRDKQSYIVMLVHGIISYKKRSKNTLLDLVIVFQCHMNN